MSTASVASTASKVDFGNGRYSPLMCEVYEDSQVIFKLDSVRAEKLARKVAGDVGAIMAAAPVTVKLGKIDKDGKLTIAEASKLKGITVTNNLLALKALHFAAEAGKNGFSWKHTTWEPMKDLADYLATL